MFFFFREKKVKFRRFSAVRLIYYTVRTKISKHLRPNLIFQDFARLFRDFAQIFDKSKILGLRLHPSLLHHCFIAASTTETQARIF